MANSSAAFWAVNGVSLHKYAWSVMSKAGRLAVPALRGDDAQVAGYPGEYWLPKEVDARTLSLPMWVQGCDPETGAAVANPEATFHDNYEYLCRALWIPDKTFVLTRRWWHTDSTGAAVIVEADTLGQLATGCDLAVTMTGPARGTFEAQIRLHHPFFYGPTQTTALVAGQATTAENPGGTNAWSRNFYVDFTGPATNARLTNTTPAPDVYCQVNGKILAGETVTLDVGNYLALSAKTGVLGRTNRTGDVVNSGTRPWMAAVRGTNSLTFAATGTSAATRCTVRFRPPYLM